MSSRAPQRPTRPSDPTRTARAATARAARAGTARAGTARAGTARAGTAFRVASAVVVVALVAVSVALVSSGTAFAAVELVVQQQPPGAPAPAASVDQVLTNVRNWIMGIAGALATVFLTVGAVRYMAAGGDLGEVEKAKTAFRSAGFGYAIAVLAPLVVTVLRGIVGA